MRSRIEPSMESSSSTSWEKGVRKEEADSSSEAMVWNSVREAGERPWNVGEGARMSDRKNRRGQLSDCG